MSRLASRASPGALRYERDQKGFTYPRGNMVGSFIVTHLLTFGPRTPATLCT
jgi:hypothetical protein